jgi:prepilin signal peptidase PulO-like enzyme (type II secretory pathway)
MNMGILPITIASFFFGTVWGSFFYTLALRYADGSMSHKPLRALFSRSHCPACKKEISPIMLLPIFGYMIQKGKCRNCGNTISAWYPASEVLYGALAALFAWLLGPTIYTLNLYLISCIALCIAIVDVKTLTIPDSLVVALVLFSIYPIILNSNLKDNLFGLASLFAVFIIILLLFPGSFGGGDVKLASAIGLLSGLEQSIVVLEISLVTGALVGILYAIKTKKSLRTKIPFAPFLTAGLIISLLWGRDILLVYFRILY